jgi:hypothetical protein
MGATITGGAVELQIEQQAKPAGAQLEVVQVMLVHLRKHQEEERAV